MVEPAFNASDLRNIEYQPLSIGSHCLHWGSRTYVMGILNITSDSFSGDGLIGDESMETDFLAAALAQARRFIEAGADIIDVGGESTRPGAKPVSAEEEMSRVIPVIQKLSAELDGIISIDTYKSQVAESALKAGADIINDVWGLRADPALAGIAARYHAPIILMHNRSSWAHAEIKAGLGGRYIGMEYTDLIEDIRRELLESIDIALKAGVPAEHIILDPGIGFGKTVEQNLELIDRLGEFRSLGFPILLGPSRKSFIGYTLDLPADQRLEGTLAAISIGIARGADIVRIHDVQAGVRAVRMADAIIRRGEPNSSI